MQQAPYNPNAPQQPVQQPAAAMAFTLDENSAMLAGDVPFIVDSGAYICTINRAQYRQNTTGSHALVFSFADQTDKQGTVSLTYLAKDGATPVFGGNFINAMLYLIGLPGFTWQASQDEQQQAIQIAPEFTGKQIGFVVESVKNQNDDGRHLELRQVYDPASGCTASEAKEGKAPEAVSKLLAKLAL